MPKQGYAMRQAGLGKSLLALSLGSQQPARAA